jgi:Trk K+ transport system NAD-binding subunit
VPTGGTELRRGDRLTILVPAAHADGLADIVGAAALGSPAEPTPRRAPDDVSARLPSQSGLAVAAPPGSTVLEPVVAARSAAAGRIVRELRLGAGVLLVAIHRKDAVIVPRGDTRLEAGDRVVLIAPRERTERVLAAFRPR